MFKKTTIYSLILTFAFITTSQAAYIVGQSDSSKVHSVKKIKKNVEKNIIIQDLPEFLIEGEGPEISQRYQEIIYSDSTLPSHLQFKLKTPQLDIWPNSEVRTLINQGPVNNRIDLTIVGDGYTLQEKQRFFDDAQRITDDLFKEVTFKSYLPLFNVHAVFVPSQDSGITDVQKKKTALGLYRSPKGSKRAIMPGNTRSIDRAIALAPDSDFPILLANDDFYGGLGGRYAITTRSLKSGSMVLRHELGHNFGSVGEEYDGGQVYQGANHSATTNVHWKHWVNGKEQVNVYKSKFLSGNYVWQKLKNNSYESNINFPKGNYDLQLKISSVGWSSANDVNVFIDNEKIALDGDYTNDRSFFYYTDANMSPGRHKLKAQENISDGDNVLAFLQVFAHQKNINKNRYFIGAYNTFNFRGREAGYRPTFTTCLMRDMRSKDFCVVDKENMWQRFLQRVELLDRLEVRQNKGGYMLITDMPNLDGLFVRLYKVGAKGQENLLTTSSNALQLDNIESGSYVLRIEFHTPEVRKETKNFTYEEKFVVP